MNVDKVKFNNIQNARVPQRSNVPNFTATTTPATKLITQATFSEEIKHIMPPFISGMKKLNDNMGEVQNIFINALGTGLVAPIFIKWNPLSKTDEDTRTYSAWRQPVSAVLAVITQAGVTIPVNRFVEKMSNNGYYDEAYNKTLFQDKSYITKSIKKQFHNLTKQQLEDKVALKVAEQEATLLRMIRANNVVFSTHDGKSVKMIDKNYIALLTETVNKKMRHEDAELTKCTDKRIPLKIKRGEYYRTHDKESFDILTDINNRLEKSTDPKGIKKYVKSLKQKHKSADKELLAIFDEIIGQRGNTKEDLKIAMQSKMTGMLADQHMYTGCTSKEALETLVKNNVQKRINEINDAKKLLTNILEAIERRDTVAKIENLIEKTVRDTEHRLKDLKFAEEVAELFKKKILNNIKGHKQIEGLIVSFAMLPITCTLLNWVYPRFMDAIFPNLSNKKHPKEIHNLVEKANQKAEVRA